MCIDHQHTQCTSLVGTPLSTVCCDASGFCMPISNGTETTSVVCCRSKQFCSTFAPISCDLQRQNDTVNPSGIFKTIDYSPLEPCNGLCCPHGYACNGTACLLDDVNQSAAPSSALTTNSLLSAALAESSSVASATTAATTDASPTRIPSSMTPSTELSSAELPTSVVIDTSKLPGPSSSQSIQSSIASSLPTENSTSLPTTQSSSSETKTTQDQAYKKLIAPITVVAVVAWLLLVFAAWKILKRRKRKSCEKKNSQEPLEKPDVPLKAAKKSSLRFELPAVPKFWELPGSPAAVELPATPVRLLSPLSHNRPTYIRQPSRE